MVPVCGSVGSFCASPGGLQAAGTVATIPEDTRERKRAKFGVGEGRKSEILGGPGEGRNSRPRTQKRGPKVVLQHTQHNTHRTQHTQHNSVIFLSSSANWPEFPRGMQGRSELMLWHQRRRARRQDSSNELERLA